MASVSGLSSNNYVSSLYNSSNIISGLASGLDTESMIENLTKSYQTKITQLQQKQTKLSWKQDAYRSIISKSYAFSNKYTSYTSSTNLLSQSFWNSAQTSAVHGTNSGKVSASGTTTSDVVLNSVSQLATSARFVSRGLFGQNNYDAASSSSWIEAANGIDLEGTTEVNALQGSLTVTYGNKNVSVVFTENDKIVAQKKANGAMETADEALARVINEKLGEETIALSSGSSVSASERIKAEVSGGKISFKPVQAGSNGADKAGNSIYISGGSGVFEGAAPEKPDEEKISSFDIPKSYDFNTSTNEETGETSYFRKNVSNLSKISGATMNINLDGVTKQITMPKIKANSDGSYQVGDKKIAAQDDKDALKKAVNNEFVSQLGAAVKKEFGNKIEVSNTSGDTTLKLNFKVADGSNILVNSDAGDALGIGKTATNYLNTSKTLEELGVSFDGLTPNKGKYDFEINGKVIGSYDKNTKLSDILSDINSKSDVKVSYSRTSREFVFTSKDTGEHTSVDMGAGLAQKMFGKSSSSYQKDSKLSEILGKDADYGTKHNNFTVKIGGTDFSIDVDENSTMESIRKDLQDMVGTVCALDPDFEGYQRDYQISFNEDTNSFEVKDKDGKAIEIAAANKLAEDAMSAVEKSGEYTAGKDAKFTVTVNGTEKTMTRSTNSAEIDGLTINFKGTFETKDGDDPVTFQTEVQSDKVVDEVKNMIAELNVILAEARSQYATMPQQYSNGSIKEYEPLTDEDKASMSESAIQNYEEKAKQGLLFADSNLSGLYQNIVSIFTRTGTDRTLMDKMGIGLSYDTNGAATITVDENKLRSTLESDFDGVVDLFTRSKENGAATDGIMQGIKTQMDRYTSTTGAVKGILVQQAGTPLASLSLLDNGWQKEIDSYATQIEKWQEKLQNQVDRYTKMFTRLETLTNQMNSQSSALAGLMGGQ